VAEQVNTAPDYGWRDSEPVPSQTYLAKPVVKWLKQVQARRVLDLGCGNGAMSHYLQRQGFYVVGCDVDERGVEEASKGASGAVFTQVGVYDPPELLGETGFDVVVANEVIEHLFLPAALPRFASKVLKPGGHLIVTTPYHGYVKNLFICLAGRWDRRHDPLWDGGHIKFFSRRTLTALLGRNGFDVVGFKGVGRPPYLWKSMVVLARMCDMRRTDGISRSQ
jgi:2-polyprenyl-3-methyl-5-hydroxy-6-metoxy-1,4-benzoquinol methylase